jgi:uncharacterized protein (DUF608 family)
LFVAAYVRAVDGVDGVDGEDVGRGGGATPYARVLRASAPPLQLQPIGTFDADANPSSSSSSSSSSTVPEVAGLNYSGAYPVVRLTVLDPAAPVNITMHALSPLQLYNATNSNIPSIQFAITFANPLDSGAIYDVAQLVVLPAFASKNQQRITNRSVAAEDPAAGQSKCS